MSHVVSVKTVRYFGRFDIILCRNALMYLSDDKRTHILEAIAPSMEDGGLLMLGAAETVIGQTQKFRASRAFFDFYELSPDQQGT
jgi:chemotaxis protein methyltransferase CheR